MLECLIVGDSIAVGTHLARPRCAVMAHSGYNTRQWNQRYSQGQLAADTVIISLGTNDYPGIKTESELRTVRARVQAKRVYWILPSIKPDVQAIVRQIAVEHGDVILPIVNLQPDQVHPTWAGYTAIAKATQ